MRQAFEALHRQRFGFTAPDKPIDRRSARSRGRRHDRSSPRSRGGDGQRLGAAGFGAALNGANALLCARRLARRRDLSARRTSGPATVSTGPALVIEPHQTVVVETGWQLRRDGARRSRADPTCPARPRTPSRATSRSGPARSLQQPVHGRRRTDGRSAARHSADRSTSRSGWTSVARSSIPPAASSPTRRISPCISAPWTARSKASSAPRGASHEARRRLHAERALQRRHAPARHHRRHAGVRRRRRSTFIFFVASRGHHEDIGGLTPGSMTPRATTHRGRRRADRQRQAGRSRAFPRRRTCCAVLASGHYPARQPMKNIADLKAQVAANARGAAEIRRMIARLRPRRRRTPTCATSRTTPKKACAG